ncbi:MAG: YebC/PmpR family DNA-binding transcriptional regulator [Planctomycetota bacterium]|nr:YebC/PmpR family DNA-binding transcriptional regulator [Planctomycetota bacterium]
MAGHSHAANIAVRKGKQDRLRAKVFSKLSKNIMVAARGGPDPSFNFALRHAVDLARAQSMPNDKIDHAIKKGAGLIEGIQVSEITYEAYAPGGVGLLIEVVTDNPNRTRPELNTILEKGGGRFGAANSVGWMFKRRGLLAVKTSAATEDTLMDLILNAGADDMSQSGDVFEILTAPESFDAVKKALAEAKIEPTMAEMKYLADNEIDVEDDETAKKILDLISNLDDHDDVNAVHSNLKFTEKVIELTKA